MISVLKRICTATAVTMVCAVPIWAEGNLASQPTRLPDMAIDSAELTLSVNEFELETGKYYRWRIVHDGGEEFQIVAPDLFRNSWINQVVIEDLEVQILLFNTTFQTPQSYSAPYSTPLVLFNTLLHCSAPYSTPRIAHHPGFIAQHPCSKCLFCVVSSSTPLPGIIQHPVEHPDGGQEDYTGGI